MTLLEQIERLEQKTAVDVSMFTPEEQETIRQKSSRVMPAVPHEGTPLNAENLSSPNKAALLSLLPGTVAGGATGGLLGAMLDGLQKDGPQVASDMVTSDMAVGGGVAGSVMGLALSIPIALLIRQHRQRRNAMTLEEMKQRKFDRSEA